MRVDCFRVLLLAPLLLSACGTPPRVAAPEVQTWGTMREVLREGRSEGRVLLAGIAGPNAIGVGALAGLAGEVTIVDGHVLVATADGPLSEGAAPTMDAVRGTVAGERASLLVLAEVERWETITLTDCASYEELEIAIAVQLRERGHLLTDPVPVRIRGVAEQLELHVIAGACPIATPDGPAPWRYAGAGGEVELVGFYVEGAAGRLTHHNHSSHLHAIAEGGQLMGHLDAIALSEVVLLLPTD